jgi:two-component system LytT family response regulator
MLNCAIIDDEQRFIDVIKKYIYNHAQLSFVREAHCVKSGIELIKNNQFDLVFLDIELSDGVSFDILEQFPNRDFQVIFTTGHNDYAIKAIKHSAIDYLLKPIDVDEFNIAVQKSLEMHGNRLNNLKLDLMLSSIKNNSFSKVVLNTETGFEFLDKSEIIHCEASVSYTVFYLKHGQKIIAALNIKKVQELLSESNFFRIHKSYVVNIDYIKKINKTEGGTVVMVNGVTLPISRRKKETFYKKVGINK